MKDFLPSWACKLSGLRPFFNEGGSVPALNHLPTYLPLFVICLKIYPDVVFRMVRSREAFSN